MRMLPSGNTLCDVGTDHALLPTAALINKTFIRAVATDLRKGPLERAESTLKKHKVADKVELRLGSGLEPISPGECDVIVIAGMGALTIIEMLSNCPDTAKKAKMLVLQPMQAQERLRPWLREHGYTIKEERLAAEGEKLYQVIAVKWCGESKDEMLNDRRLEPCHGKPEFEIPDHVYDLVGGGIVHNRDVLAVRWVRKWTKRQEQIVEGLGKSNNIHELEDAMGILKGLEKCTEYLEANLSQAVAHKKLAVEL